MFFIAGQPWPPDGDQQLASPTAALMERLQAELMIVQLKVQSPRDPHRGVFLQDATAGSARLWDLATLTRW